VTINPKPRPRAHTRALPRQAAEGEAGVLLAAMRTRGCKEEMVPSPELLAEGKARAPARRGCGRCMRARGSLWTRVQAVSGRINIDVQHNPLGFV
jgi:hypothetical protein